MKTLVTGTTGFLGAALLRELIADGRDVRVLVRPDADRSNIEGLDAEVVTGDVRDRDSLAAALEPGQANDVRHQCPGHPQHSGSGDD